MSYLNHFKDILSLIERLSSTTQATENAVPIVWLN